MLSVHLYLSLPLAFRQDYQPEMLRLRFDVNLDKENAAPVVCINKGQVLQHCGPLKKTAHSNSGKQSQPAQRKALTNVINEPTSLSLREKQPTLCKDDLCSSLKSSCMVVCGVQSLQENQVITEEDMKTTLPSLQSLQTLKSDAIAKSKYVATPKNLMVAPPRTNISNKIYEHYHTGAILPASDRLSSYMSRLLTWRPPCLFGALPDSESEDSDIEQLPEDDILLDKALTSPTGLEFPHKDSDSLMTGLPLHKPTFGDQEQDSICESKDTESALDQTIDISFSFGGLHVMHGSPEISDSNSSTDLDLKASYKHSVQAGTTS